MSVGKKKKPTPDADTSHDSSITDSCCCGAVSMHHSVGYKHSKIFKIMTTKDFDTTDEPLCVIVSLDLSTGKVFYATYDWRAKDDLLGDFRKAFPKLMHFCTLNPAAIRERKKMFGLES